MTRTNGVITIALNTILLIIFCTMAWQHRVVIYLLRQGKGQLHVLMNAMPVEKFLAQEKVTQRQRENLALIPLIKKYSVDSLAYEPTSNFESVYDENGEPSLWVLTAARPYSLEPVTWRYPLVGEVTYKGFFDKHLAAREFVSLSRNYDVSIRPVTAWSTLGWFSDPLMSNVLGGEKGSFCNLLFHELFHATWYAPGNVDLDENLADFVAGKATIRFLKNDTTAIKKFLVSKADNEIIRKFMKETSRSLVQFYDTIINRPDRSELKKQKFLEIARRLESLPCVNRKKLRARVRELRSGNACFVDFSQYESLQDSLENVFNKIYRGNLKKMVRDLKHD
jgi:predicted aminopeptidase